jgi:o-succinylbenzoate---CoA ligase
MEDTFFLLDFFTKNNPDDTFIFTEKENYSYGETFEKITAFTIYLSSFEQVNPYTAVISNNNPDFIFLIIALWQTGRIPVLINKRLDREEINELIRFTGCSFVFTEEDGKIKYLLSENTNPLEHSTLPNTRISPDETAVIIFTSGTTGNPKGAVITFQTLIDAARIQGDFLNQQPGEKWMASLPFFHIGGFSIFMRALLNQMSIVIPASLKADDICTAADKFKPGYYSLVGTQLKTLLDKGFDPGNEVKKILIGGGFTDDSLIETALQNKWNIAKVYGSTETIAFIAAADKEDLFEYPSSSGRALVPGSIFIMDENFNELSHDKEGIVCLKDIPLMKEYYNNSEETNKKFRNGFFITGDIGYINSDGLLFILMRRTDLIISGGENINPSEIENAIRKMEGVEDVHVFPVEDIEWGQVVSAAVQSTKNYTPQEIKDYLAGKVAAYKIPKNIYFLQIPRNELGKIQLSKLTDLLEQ